METEANGVAESSNGVAESSNEDWFDVVGAADDESVTEPDDGGERTDTPAPKKPAKAGKAAPTDDVIEDAGDLERIDAKLATIPEELSDEYLDAKVKVKVNGQVKTVSLREVVGNYSLRRAIQSAHEAWSGEKKRLMDLEQDAMTIVQGVKDPKTLARLAKAHGLTKEQVLEALEDVSQMSPAERARLEYEEEKRRLAERDRREVEAKKKAEQEAETMRWVAEQKADLKAELQDAMSRGVVIDEQHWDDALMLMSDALDEGIEYTFQQALAIIEDRSEARYTKHLPAMSDERLIKTVGIERILKIAAEHTKPNGSARPSKLKPRTKGAGKPKRKRDEGEVRRDDIDNITDWFNEQ